MIQKIKKPISILLVFMMIVSLFAVVPITASAAVGEFVPESEYLTFTAEEAGSSVTLKYANGTLKYNKNNSGWEDYTKGSQIDLASAGDSVRFRGKDTTFNYSNHVSIGGKVACSGNVMSLRLDDNGMVQGLSDSCFYCMFMGCTGLTAAPKLPETTLARACYSYMFYGCTSLTTAPELPATTLARDCYSYMFYDCTSLTTAPELPATTLAPYCYGYMFYGCKSLTTAPELPATMLESYCYSNMFNGCKSLTTAPELPTTMLESGCYTYMFYGCERLTTAPALPATMLESYCYSNMFNGCTSLTTAPELPATTLASDCYSYMFRDCKSLTELPALPATTLKPNCYYGMFSKCSKIRISTTQDTTYSVPYRIPTTGEGTPADYALYYMFYGTGGEFTENPDINTTYYVYREVTKYTVTWKNGDTVLKTDEVEDGATPSYTGDEPTKADNAQYTYTFSGWTDGTNTYGVNDTLPAVTGDVTYTAVFEGTKRSYNVTWKNDDGSVIDTTSVEYGETPTHAEPTKEETTLYTYRFTGWTPEITDVTGDTEYTATFEEVDKPLFAAHSVTLSGDMGVNFFVDPAVVGADVAASESAVVKFTWDNGTKGSEVNLKEIEPESNGWYKAACTVPMAYMAHTIHAEVYINGVKQDEENDYSVQDYVSAVLEDPSKFDSDKPEELAELVKEMINYGKMAQAVFSGQMGSQAEYNEIEGYTMADVTADMIQNEIDKNPANIGKTATDITTVKPEVGAEYYTSSLIFLSESTLRHYFVVPNGSADTSMYDGCKTDHLCYVEKTGISASKLDDLQEFKVGGVTFYYSALDYAKAVIGSDKMSADQKNLAKALFLYNRAANNYFPIDLSTLGGNYEAQDGDWFTNTLSGNKVITVAANATITLIDSDITSVTAGITPLGDATIIIKGENVVRGGTYSPGIIAAAGHTITIDGTGSLETYGGYLGAGIGISQGESGGEIVINGGTIKATGSGNAAGIGGGQRGSGGEITINGGTITANGGSAAPGIGCGTAGSGGNITINGGNITAIGNSDGGAGIGCSYSGTYGNITINGGTVTASGGYGSSGIGGGYNGKCGDITINGGTVTAAGGYGSSGIGCSLLGSCGNIIINGDTVTATAGLGASGIGGGYNGSCGDITINNTVTKVSAQRGGYSPSTIGKGYGSSTCGTVTIGGNVVTTGTSPNPYVYEP